MHYSIAQYQNNGTKNREISTKLEEISLVRMQIVSVENREISTKLEEISLVRMQIVSVEWVYATEPWFQQKARYQKGLDDLEKCLKS